jgi:hypothetical protein
MKHLITDPDITIEPKGVDPMEIPNMTNFLMMSNNLMALKVERGDRRYACFNVSAEKVGDEHYWDNIHDNVLTEETAKHFFQHLRSIKDIDCVSLRKIPSTDLRESIINNSMSGYERFYNDVKEGSYEIPISAYMDEYKYKGEIFKTSYRADTLYSIYEGYCTRRKENCLRYRLFFVSSKKFLIMRRAKIDKKSILTYTIL